MNDLSPPRAPRTPLPSSSTPSALARLLGPFATYRVLPDVVGRAYLVITALARLPVTMVPLATLALVTATSGSVARGGVTSAAVAIGTAVGAPALGSACDRLGQRRVLLAALPVHAVALSSVVLLAGRTSGAGGTALTLLAALVAGLTMPQVSALSRVRWMRLSPRDVPTALAFEGTVDEISFIVGPALVGLLALAVGPRWALGLALALVVVGVAAFALHPTAPSGRPRAAATSGTDRATPPTGGRFGQLARAAAPTTAGTACMGLLFGASQAGVTQTSALLGQVEAASLVYAAMAVGSTATTLSLVLLPASVSLRRRWAVGAAGLVVGLGLMAAASGMTGLVLATLVAGLCVGPTLVTLNAVAALRAPAGRLSAAMTALSSGSVLGVATGASVGGWLAESVGPRAAFGLGALAALVLLGLAVTARPPRGHADRAPAPASAPPRPDGTLEPA